MEFVDLITVPKVDSVILTEKTNDSIPSQEGTLCLSGHHLLMSSRQDHREELWLLYRNIDVIEKKINNNQIPGGSIILKCKDFRIFQLEIPSTDQLLSVVTSLEKLSNLDQIYQYPFFYRAQSQGINNKHEDGWSAYTPVSEWSSLLASHGDEWRISYLNRDYKICSSYPSTIIVPRIIDDNVIISSANFRDNGRFPILCYRHDGGSILFRSGQPLCGPNGKRCKEDERLLNSVLGAGRRGYIIDTRTINQAQNSKTKNNGGGTEIDSAYAQWRKVYKNVPRNNELNDCLYKLIEACNDTNSSTGQWLQRLDNSGWLSAVQSAMNASCVVAQCLHQELSAVLVHGSSGRDSTLIVTSLSQIILNPNCRTICGLQSLIEREWLQAGHPFFTRTRHCAYYQSNNHNNSPTFLLFLDCLYQLHYQFQYSFEYTTDLLIELFKHSYCSEYGTFLGDTEAERINIRLAERTSSLWSYINKPEIFEKWINPLYEPNHTVIWPSVAPISLHLWKQLYLSHTNSSIWNDFNNCVKDIKKNYSTIQKFTGQLRQQVQNILDEADEHDNNTNLIDNNMDPLQALCLSQLNIDTKIS